MTNSGAAPVPTANTEKNPGTIWQITAWSLWDWGGAAFNAVMTTFIFTALYLTKNEGFGGADKATATLAFAMSVSGFAIAALAPVAGQRTDHSGRRKMWLGINTLIVVVLTGACFFVQPSESYLLLGCMLIAAGHVFFEIAGVNYNAMLLQISNKHTIGRISGFGWAAGYLGGIVALLIVFFALIKPEVGIFGITSADGMTYRAVAVFSALWILIFAIPVMLAIPETKPDPNEPKVGFFQSYKELFQTIMRLWRHERHTLFFLVSSAIFRDGLAAIFTFGAVLAVGSFGFETGDVLIFAIAGNVVAAVGALSAGFFDDKFGPKAVIVTSLVGLLVSGGALLFLDGKEAFWIFGLILCLFVGPAQSSARTFMGRLATPGHEGEMYGLYATTGRAVSFLAPMLFGWCIIIFGAQRWGIIGILAVLLLGLLLLLPVKAPAHR
ncbi:UMF1 family MFS transporter [Arthrobacter stackebrandtii]|uniref:UMF1 family MFS transporter n=1 Tax=Arthrobacter stackebrandtii TaxID=272161 RepID=A0ABS4YUQ7_9MICC|nr:MFS transporter [Arthrobacter stackebrandtii]MBP2412523.1 UMF1 family MFS transporter [Arthrobacter stackebrandtii]